MRPAAVTRVFSRLAVRDRVLFRRIATGPPHHSIARWGWTFLTHGGGVVASIVAATLPMLLGGALRHAAMRALLTLVVSHVVVQAIKRTVGRPRPRLRNAASKTWASEPDRFSFPSGHSAAVISVALAYAVAFPQFALVLLPIALFVGFSRVRLGVHYPGDVLAGQIIAVATALVVLR